MAAEVIGKPWGRARALGGGVFVVFEFFATREECDSACSQHKGAVKMFPLYLPHLNSAA